MDGMEDSGFDSDPKVMQNDTEDINLETDSVDSTGTPEKNGTTLLTKPSELQRKLEKQREAARNGQPVIDSQPKKSILSRTRLLVPTKPKSLTDVRSPHADAQPLVLLDSEDDSDDEFAMPRLSKQAQREITQQLIKDGYNLDLEPDDEDLDLIPPRPVSERCACCPGAYRNPLASCAMQ